MSDAPREVEPVEIEQAPLPSLPGFLHDVSPELIEIIRSLVKPGEEAELFPREKEYQERLTKKIEYLEALVLFQGVQKKAWESLGVRPETGGQRCKDWRKYDSVYVDLEKLVLGMFFENPTGKVKAKKKTSKITKKWHSAPSRILEWRKRFLETYARTGMRTEAAKAAKLHLTELRDMLDSASDNYDDELATGVKEIELGRIFDVEDKLFQSSKNGDSGAARFMLQNHMADTYKPAQNGSGANVFWVTPQGEKAVLDMMKDMFGEGDTSKQVGVTDIQYEVTDGKEEPDDPKLRVDALIESVASSDH